MSQSFARVRAAEEGEGGIGRNRKPRHSGRTLRTRNKPSALKEARSIDEQEDKCSIECWCKAWRLAGSSRGIWYDPRKILQEPAELLDCLIVIVSTALASGDCLQLGMGEARRG